MKRYQEINKVLWQVLLPNWAVALAKMLLGYTTGSVSMTADGFHSLADGFSNVAGLIGIRIASKPVDEDHPYGHKKYETIAAAAIGTMLFAVAVGVIRSAVARLFHPVVPEFTAASFTVMIATMIVNAVVSRYEKNEGTRLHSDVLVSDSTHTRSDLFVSGSVLVSLIAVRLGFPMLDAISSIVIAGLIAWSAFEIWKDAFGVLVDQSRVDGGEIARIALEVPGVKACHHVRSRGRDDDLKIDLHIQVRSRMSIRDAHHVGHEVEKRIRREYSNITDVVVHTEPFTGPIREGDCTAAR
ncbi:MAG: cation diffusion facilitator family transporter [Ignavibacteriales bacterium]